MTESQVAFDAQPGYFQKRIMFSRDGACAFVGWNGGLLTQLDTATGEEIARFIGHMGYVLGIAISPDGKNIVSGDRFGRVLVWEVASQRPLITLNDGGAAVTSLDWSPDGRRIVAGQLDGSVQIWTLPWAP